jgi:hypothetical protein
VTLVVQPRYLRGYAQQIDGNRTGALTQLEKFCAANCIDVRGLDGLLAPERDVVRSLANTFETLMADAGVGLNNVAYYLRLAAYDYERADTKAAEAIWLSGRKWTVPDDYREHDISDTGGGFSDGATVNLAPPQFPPPNHDNQRAREELHDLLAPVNRDVKRLTGQDLVAVVERIVYPDWGTLRRVAAAYNEMKRGYDSIAEDLSDGMDHLSPHWTSDGDGGASAAFDYDIRKRWVQGFRALADAADAARRCTEWMANAYEYVVTGLLVALAFYIARATKVLAKLKEKIRELWALSVPVLLSGILTELIDTIKAIYQLVAEAARQVIRLVKTNISGLQMVVAGVQELRDLFRGDFAVFNRNDHDLRFATQD